MIKGWRINPHWLSYYDQKREARITNKLLGDYANLARQSVETNKKSAAIYARKMEGDEQPLFIKEMKRLND